MRKIFAVIALIGVGALLHRQFAQQAAEMVTSGQAELPDGEDEPEATSESPSDARFDDPAAARTCDGRTRCREMRSCEEAMWFLAHCPGMKMDGDEDGIPCEDQWCQHLR